MADAQARDEEQTKPGTTADVHYDFTQFGLDKSQHTIAHNLRTSQIIDPPDGRIPPQTPEALLRLYGRGRVVSPGVLETAGGRRLRAGTFPISIDTAHIVEQARQAA